MSTETPALGKNDDQPIEGGEIGELKELTFHEAKQRGEIGKIPSQFAASQASFRGVWDEAGSITDLQEALELVRSWLLEAKEVDELTGRTIRRSML
jgi:hypothetical protein